MNQLEKITMMAEVSPSIYKIDAFHFAVHPVQNCSVGIVGEDTPFAICDDVLVQPYVSF